MSEKSILFDFGGMSPADINRVAKELKERSFGELETDAEAMQTAGNVGAQFLQFLSFVFRKLGLLDQHGLMANPYLPIPTDTRYGEKPTEIMRQAWNQRATSWGVVETPANYAITMQTLLEFLQVANKDKPETLLSLGSGPGFYETFLAQLMQQSKLESIRIIALDYAKEMTRRHHEVLGKLYLTENEGGGQIRKLKNIEAVTGDMTNLKFATGSVDQIICNNSLQWVADWRKAIAEMARVINPKGLGWLYLFVHTHPMVVYDMRGELMFRLGEFEIPELLDALEANKFSPYHMRQIAGSPGTGQAGMQTSRVFIKARFTPTGVMTSWRKAQISSRLSGIRM